MALLQAGCKISASSDGLVRKDLMSASAGWLFWVELTKVPAEVEREVPCDVEAYEGSSIVVLLSDTTLAHGRLSTLSSYRAACTGALVIVYLLNRLQAYLQLPTLPTVKHTAITKA